MARNRLDKWARKALSAALLIASGSFGCERKYVDKVALHDAGDRATIVQLAPRSGMYHVQLLDDGKYLHEPPFEANRYFMRGDRMGFRESPDHTLIGLAGDEEIQFPELPAVATQAMWFRKAKQPTHFGREVGKATDTAVEAAKDAMIAGAVIGAAAIVVTSSVELDWLGDGCDEATSSHAHCDHQSRSHHRS